MNVIHKKQYFRIEKCYLKGHLVNRSMPYSLFNPIYSVNGSESGWILFLFFFKISIFIFPSILGLVIPIWDKFLVFKYKLIMSKFDGIDNLHLIQNERVLCENSVFDNQPRVKIRDPDRFDLRGELICG